MAAASRLESLEVSDYMSAQPQTVEPQLLAVELARLLNARGQTGAPVVDDGVLVGVVSRSDLARTMTVARSRAEEISDFYRDPVVPAESALDEIATLSGEQLQHVRVKDLMSTRVISVAPDASVSEAAARLLEHHVHRLLVLDDGRLVGLLSSQDLLRVLAEHHD